MASHSPDNVGSRIAQTDFTTQNLPYQDESFSSTPTGPHSAVNPASVRSTPEGVPSSEDQGIKQKHWVAELDQEAKDDTRSQPWKKIVGDKAQDRHYLAYQPWHSAGNTDPFKRSASNVCSYCKGKGCQNCDSTISFAG